MECREQCLKFRVRRGVEHLPGIIQEVQSEIESFHSMLDVSIIAGPLGDGRISEGDQCLLHMRFLPHEVREIFQLHQSATNRKSRLERRNCREPKKCSRGGKKVHVAKSRQETKAKTQSRFSKRKGGRDKNASIGRGSCRGRGGRTTR